MRGTGPSSVPAGQACSASLWMCAAPPAVRAGLSVAGETACACVLASCACAALPAIHRPCSLLQAAILRQTLDAPPGSSGAAPEGAQSPARTRASAAPPSAAAPQRTAEPPAPEGAPTLQPPEGAPWARLRCGVDARELDAALAASNAAARKQVRSGSPGWQGVGPLPARMCFLSQAPLDSRAQAKSAPEAPGDGRAGGARAVSVCVWETLGAVRGVGAGTVLLPQAPRGSCAGASRVSGLEWQGMGH